MAKIQVSQKWMFSFADLLSLILTFFVLIFSMADPMQFRNGLSNDNNSPIQIQEGLNESKIIVSNNLNYADEDYLKRVITDKISKDEGMQIFSTNSINDKFVISTKQSLLRPESYKALYDTISKFNNEKRIAAADFDSARKFALELKKYGKIENLSYFEIPELKDKIEIVVYSQF